MPITIPSLGLLSSIFKSRKKTTREESIKCLKNLSKSRPNNPVLQSKKIVKCNVVAESRLSVAFSKRTNNGFIGCRDTYASVCSATADEMIILHIRDEILSNSCLFFGLMCYIDNLESIIGTNSRSLFYNAVYTPLADQKSRKDCFAILPGSTWTGHALNRSLFTAVIKGFCVANPEVQFALTQADTFSEMCRTVKCVRYIQPTLSAFRRFLKGYTKVNTEQLSSLCSANRGWVNVFCRYNSKALLIQP